MGLITYDKTNKRPEFRSSEIFISFNARGKINFSQGARRMLSLSEGDRAILHQDSVFRSNWYLEITREQKGFKISLGKTDSRFTCTRAALNLFKSIGKDPQKMSFKIFKSTKTGVLNLWTIQTSKPLI